MTDPAWKEIKKVKVEAKPAGIWNIALPYICGSRLLRFSIQTTDDKKATVPKEWAPSPKKKCGPDGVPMTKTGALLSTAPFGAIVGKIGGSTADLPDTTAPSTSPYSGKKVFAVGAYAVVSIAATDCGPLFVTMNDSPDGFEDHSGELWVLIEEAPL